MTGAVLDRPATHSVEPSSGARPAGGRVRLEELLNAALRTARTHGSAECPVCAAAMAARGQGLRCTGCGSALS